jgi:catechol 2,3-dioxygenase-like lactoylglutathione lyase family enzyme
LGSYIDVYQYGGKKMKLHVSLDVNNLEKSAQFYTTLFASQPTKVKPGYAKFDLTEPAVVLTLNEKPGHLPNGPNHMGVRVRGIEQVLAAKLRLENAGYQTADEMGTTCCYAVQDKIWATDPNGYRWEVYVFHGDAEQYGKSPVLGAAGVACCAGEKKEELQAAGCGCK